MKRVITFGTFDLFHVGHLRILERARSMGNCLIVGVSTDQLTLAKKGRLPVFGQEERLQIIKALRVVDEAFLEESLAMKRGYIERHSATILVMGDDWSGKFDDMKDRCEVVYLPRTPTISTTATIEKIRL
ncbi:MAG TPA: adenylyltransferase/cytidyltransferase family protein [Verrucomicrobiae bacterium]|nr:adenylyltransferase/cytidyltransferase family protein [Verrucomicrobiae bacterium]